MPVPRSVAKMYTHCFFLHLLRNVIFLSSFTGVISATSEDFMDKWCELKWGNWGWNWSKRWHDGNELWENKFSLSTVWHYVVRFLWPSYTENFWLQLKFCIGYSCVWRKYWKIFGEAKTVINSTLFFPGICRKLFKA